MAMSTVVGEQLDAVQIELYSLKLNIKTGRKGEKGQKSNHMCISNLIPLPDF
jgi:hypothetical protein